MGSPSEGQPFAIIIALVALTVALVVTGFVLRGRGVLAGRNAALGWAVLCILPLFGAGFLFFAKHAVERATGEDRPDVTSDAGPAPAAR